jgi:hypothetical protein
MNNKELQKKILGILLKLEGIAIRESVLGAEAEIAIGHPLNTDEFGRELKVLIGERFIKKSFDAWDEAMYEITPDGKKAIMGR